MAQVKIDMSNPEDYQKSNVVPEPGTYDLVISNRLKLEKAKTSDNQITKIELEGHLEDGTKFKVFDNLVHNAKSHWKIYQFFRALGFGDEEIAAGIDLDDCYQMPLQAKLGQRIHEGEPQAQVKKYLYEKA